MKDKIYDSLRQRYDGHKILILGFGKEGRSTYELFRQLEGNFDLFIMDQNDQVASDYIKAAKDVHTVVLEASEYMKNLDAFDVIFKTPGLPGYLLNHIGKAKITSQTQIFLEYLGDRTIGITGTKGKSTTSSIIAHILANEGIKIKLIGNIGQPALESLVEDDGETLYAYEMSSFQTEFLQVGPRIGVILNLFQEHLNNYEGYEAYQESKLQLFKAKVKDPSRQTLIYGCDNHLLTEKIKALRKIHDDRRYMAFGQLLRNTMSDHGYFLDEDFIVRQDDNGISKVSGTDFSRKILGEHNLLNSLVAFIVVDALVEEGLVQPIEPDHIISHLSTFRGLPHRLEEVGTYSNITFYNDSISTVPEATVMAIKAIDNLDTLIVGGFDRKIGYHYLASYFDALPGLSLICLPDTGYQIYDLLKDKKRAFKVEDMVEAVAKAYEITGKGKSCLLSPAASSYNQYKNFEERGDHYVECIKKFQETVPE